MGYLNRQSYTIFFIALSGYILSILSCSTYEKEADVSKMPNIVLIVADDLGFGDIGCYGGDINTPNIDSLAYSGIRFSSFHTAPMCAPTRAMLLSGNDNHIAGMGAQSLRSNEFGYEGRLTNRIVTISSLLHDAGYHTYMAGKWHLGKDPESNPANKGFENSFVLLEGAGNHYLNKSALNGDNSSYTEDGIPVLWPDGSYSTDYYTDKIIGFINRNKHDNRPFFVYAAYTSPHWPLQVDKKHWHKYKGMYDNGYEELRLKRLKSLKESNIIPLDSEIPPYHQSVIPWDSLSTFEKRKESRKMELYAGMVDNLDHNIGRIMAYLRSINENDNTIFIFMSDNGAAHRDFYNDQRFVVLKENYNDDYDNMGNADSYIAYGPQWAEAGSAPFRYFKDYATQGGINTTLIISGSGIKRKNEICHDFLSLLDIAPTIYEAAQISYPREYKGNEIYPLKGESILPYLKGDYDSLHDSDYVFAIEHYGNAMLRKGKWKITNYDKPFSIDNFKLFDISNDLGELYDLKLEEKEKYAELIDLWKKYVDEVKIKIPPPRSE